MRQKNKSLLKNIGIFTLGSFTSNAISFLMIPLYTSVLSTSEFGSVDLMSSTASLLSPILLLSIQDATLRFTMDNNYKKEDVLSTSLNVVLKGTTILTIAIVLIGIVRIFPVSNQYLLFLWMIFVLGAISSIFNLYLKAENKAKIIACSGIIGTIAVCSCNYLFLVVLKYGVAGYMFSNVISLLLQIIYQLITGKIYKDIHFKKYNNISKPMIRYSSPLIANSISWWVNNASDRYILTAVRGIAESGIYTVAYNIPTILTLFQNIVYNAWSISAIAEFDENDTDGFIGRNYELYSCISILICSILLVMNIPLARFLYKGDFFNAWKCVSFLLLGTVFSGISQFEGSLYAAVKETRLVAKTTVVGAITNTILNIVLICIFGAIGAAISTCVGYCITWLLRTMFMQRFVKMKVNWKKHFILLAFLVCQTIYATFDSKSNVQIVIPIMLISSLCNQIRRK